MKVLVDKEFLEDGLELVCDSIRLKTGGTGVLAFPVEIKAAVDSIQTGSGGIVPTGAKEITANGTYDVTTFASAEVAVPIPAAPSGVLEITENGEGIDVAQYAEVDVAVPVGIVPTGGLPITANGIYDVTNYASAEVNVTSGGYDAAEMDDSSQSATSNTGNKLTAVCTIPADEGLAGIYIIGKNRSTLWGIFELLLIGSGNNWHAEGWRKGVSGPVTGIADPIITVTSEAVGNSIRYTIEITLTSTYESFVTTADNYSVMPIRMVKN